jgi:hypothetical protein
MQTRLVGVSIENFGGTAEDIVMYSTHTLEPPPAFKDVWHIASDRAGGFRLSQKETQLLNNAAIVVIFGDTYDDQQMRDAYDVSFCISRLGVRAPPVILAPHSMEPNLRPQINDAEAEFHAWSKAVNAGIDDVIIGEPVGIRLACEIRSRIMQQSRNATVLNDKVNERRELLQHVCALEDVIYDIIWDYLRVRLRTEIPGIDDLIDPGIPQTINDLVVGQKLGEGSFGVVCRLVHPSNLRQSAGEVLKLMNKKPLTNFHGIASLKRQIGVMKMLSSPRFAHPNIAQFYDVYHTETHILFRMEDAGPLDLYKRLVLREENEMPLSFPKVLSLISQCIDGLCHLHSGPKIVHRDIKPENLIVSETASGITVKFADFDTTQVSRPGTLCRGVIGTFPFMAPEVVLERKYDPYAADVWSLGVVILETACCLSILKRALQLPRLKKDMDAEKARAERQMMETIAGFFCIGGNVTKLLEKYLRPELDDMLDDTCEVLDVMLEVTVEDRATAPGVFEFIQSLKTFGSPTNA